MSNIKKPNHNFDKGFATTVKLFRKSSIKADPDKYHVLENTKNKTYPMRVDNIAISNNKCKNNEILI